MSVVGLEAAGACSHSTCPALNPFAQPSFLSFLSFFDSRQKVPSASSTKMLPPYKPCVADCPLQMATWS